jgi:hypothetical protein
MLFPHTCTVQAGMLASADYLRHLAPKWYAASFMRKVSAVFAAICLTALLLLSTSGAFLVVNNPQHADLIVALAGETDRRPARAFQLLQDGYAPRVLLDVPANGKIYDQQMIDIARAYTNTLPEHQRIAICPIVGLSTKAETQDVAHCVAAGPPSKRILIVTSDYHTRRALSTFKHELPGLEFSVASATDAAKFGGSWWKHRQWAKINLDEWLKLMWWQVVDRWRK